MGKEMNRREILRAGLAATSLLAIGVPDWAIPVVTRRGGAHEILGFALNDGTALRSVEVKVDDGPWQAATLESSNAQYSWKLFTYSWQGATPGEHTLVSRATDVNGKVQLTEADLETKRTFLEHSAQFPRTVMIA